MSDPLYILAYTCSLLDKYVDKKQKKAGDPAFSFPIKGF